jgi:periplasmic divalent cation tolerance protein
VTSFSFVYTTFPDLALAQQVAQTIVRERLAACANILPAMQSYYWWEGKVDSAQEVVLIAKTRKELFEPLRARIQSLHPYSCPCIIALPIELGHAPFLNWIEQETHDK